MSKLTNFAWRWPLYWEARMKLTNYHLTHIVMYPSLTKRFVARVSGYARENPELGYTQGMCFLAAVTCSKGAWAALVSFRWRDGCFRCSAFGAECTVLRTWLWHILTKFVWRCLKYELLQRRRSSRGRDSAMAGQLFEDYMASFKWLPSPGHGVWRIGEGSCILVTFSCLLVFCATQASWEECDSSSTSIHQKPKVV